MKNWDFWRPTQWFFETDLGTLKNQDVLRNSGHLATFIDW